MPPLRSRIVSLVVGSIALGWAGPARAGDLYDDAFARAGELERAGQLEGAAQILEAVAPAYPQDYAIALQIGWLHFRAGRFEAAARAYRAAIERSPGAQEARRGLSLSLAQLAPPPEPEPEWRVTPALALTGLYFPDHPYKTWSGGVTAGLGVARGSWTAGATYRWARFAPASSSTLASWDQHEGYLAAGYATRDFGLGLTYGLVADGSAALGTSHHAGIFARWSPFGDIELDAAASFYSDLTVLRAAPSWRIPLFGGLSVRPGAAVQWAGGEVLGTGSLTLSLDGARGGLFVGGKYGTEVRPAYLGIPLVYDITERIPYGLWAGGSLNVGDGARIHVSYSMDRLKRTDGASPTESDAHALTLGTTLSF